MKNLTIIDDSLGFPVIVANPRYIVFEGEKILDINPKLMMESVFKIIPEKKGRLSGAEVRFLRAFMHLTQEAFGSLIGVNHSSVAKWEAKKNESTGMDVQVEIILRARCRLFQNNKAHIGTKFLDNIIFDYCNSNEVGKPITINL